MRNKNYTLTTFLCLLAALLLTACGGGKKEPAFTLTPQGVGSLQTDSLFRDMSASDEGLYNRLQVDEWEDQRGRKMQNLTMYWNDELVATATIRKSDGILGEIYFHSPRIAWPDGLYHGMPLSEALEKGLIAMVSEDALGEETDTGFYWTVMENAARKIHYIISVGVDASPDQFLPEAWERITEEFANLPGTSPVVGPADLKPDNGVTLTCIGIGGC